MVRDVRSVLKYLILYVFIFFFSSRSRHTRYWRDWSSDGVLFRSSRPATAVTSSGDGTADGTPVDCLRHGGIPVNDLIDTTEMYLRTIFELEEEGIVPLRARIAERLHQSGPTVSQTVARMERDGLLTVEGDRHLQLSDEGRRLATAVMRKHRLAECLLVDVIGLDYEQVHEEACRWEHVMSENVERKLLALLNNPTVSPFGNPIPGLDALEIGRAH